MSDYNTRSGRLSIDDIAADAVVAVADGAEHGYIGYTPDPAPNHDYTVAGVTGVGTARANDTPPVTAEATARSRTEPLKGTRKASTAATSPAATTT